MKISAEILRGLKACESGFDRFVKVHGESEIGFTDCIRSGSNTISDLLWYIDNQYPSEVWLRDIKFFACDCAERVITIYESSHPNDSRPRDAIDEARKYISGGISRDELIEARRAAAYAANAAYAAAAYAADAAAYAAAANAANAAANAVAYAAYAANAAANAANAVAYAANAAANAAEKAWQRERLAQIVESWEIEK